MPVLSKVLERTRCCSLPPSMLTKRWHVVAASVGLVGGACLLGRGGVGVGEGRRQPQAWPAAVLGHASLGVSGGGKVGRRHNYAVGEHFSDTSKKLLL